MWPNFRLALTGDILSCLSRKFYWLFLAGFVTYINLFIFSFEAGDLQTWHMEGMKYFLRMHICQLGMVAHGCNTSMGIARIGRLKQEDHLDPQVDTSLGNTVRLISKNKTKQTKISRKYIIQEAKITNYHLLLQPALLSTI